MKCPLCAKEMQTGRVESGREIMWRGDAERKPMRISSKLFGNSHAYAERCDECGIVVVREETRQELC